MSPSSKRRPSTPSTSRAATSPRQPHATAPSAPPAPAFAPLERTNFVPYTVLGAEEFTAEQRYFIDRARRHNMALHGAGVASGLAVTLGEGEVRVEPGLALDCAGNEIVLARPVTCPLPEQDEALFVVVAYAEVRTRPVPVVSDPGSGAATAVASRIVEDVAFALEPADPSAAHAPGRPCGVAHGLALARLVREKGGWKLDPKFAPHRVGA